MVQIISGNAASLNGALTQATESKGITDPFTGPVAEISRADMTKVLSQVAANPADIEVLKRVQEGYTYAMLDHVNGGDLPPGATTEKVENIMYSRAWGHGSASRWTRPR
ncbi:MAG: hypothetical protein HOV68_10400, partial [Streptomycetaceae bacterium]|nr:hypothetical protein [Streptomycetaceae bacterium]